MKTKNKTNKKELSLYFNKGDYTEPSKLVSVAPPSIA
jgi:hypothetical protein